MSFFSNLFNTNKNTVNPLNPLNLNSDYRNFIKKLEDNNLQEYIPAFDSYFKEYDFDIKVRLGLFNNATINFVDNVIILKYVKAIDQKEERRNFELKRKFDSGENPYAEIRYVNRKVVFSFKPLPKTIEGFYSRNFYNSLCYVDSQGKDVFFYWDTSYDSEGYNGK